MKEKGVKEKETHLGPHLKVLEEWTGSWSGLHPSASEQTGKSIKLSRKEVSYLAPLLREWAACDPQTQPAALIRIPPKALWHRGY